MWAERSTQMHLQQDLMKAKKDKAILSVWEKINKEDSAVPKGQRSGSKISPSPMPLSQKSKVSTLRGLPPILYKPLIGLPLLPSRYNL